MLRARDDADEVGEDVVGDSEDEDSEGGGVERVGVLVEVALVGAVVLDVGRAVG